MPDKNVFVCLGALDPAESLTIGLRVVVGQTWEVDNMALGHTVSVYLASGIKHIDNQSIIGLQ